MSRLDELAADAGLTPQTKLARAGVRPGQSTQHLEGTRVTTEAATNGRPRNLYQKLAAISGELGAIEKDGRAPQEMGGFAFISHGALMAHLRQKLADRQVALMKSLRITTDEVVMMRTSQGERANRRVVVELTMEFVNGENPDDRYTVTWPGEALDTRDKAVQKAATSAEKAVLLKAFNVSDKDDPDGANTEGDLAGSGDQRQPPASGLTTPAQARQQPPQGRTPQAEKKHCPKCDPEGKKDSLVMGPDGGALCVAAKNGCGAKLTREDFAAPAAPVAPPPADAPPEPGAAPAPQPAPTLAQQIAIACREIGITDTAGRDRLRLAVTGKEKNADLTEAEALKVLKAAKSIGRGEARLENSEGAWHVVDIARGAA